MSYYDPSQPPQYPGQQTSWPNWQQSQQPYPYQPPPPKKSRRRLWLILSIVGGILVVSCVTCGVVGAFNPAPKAAATPTQAVSQNSLPTPTPTFTAQATTAVPTATATQPAPTATHASSSVTYGTPRLGGPVSDFIGKYGNPDTGCATCASGVYSFQRYQGTQLDYISVLLTDENRHTNAFDVQAPPNSDWDATTATALCQSFGPSDVNYSHPIKVMPFSDGSAVEKVYKSAWLAGQLAAGDWQDLNAMSGNTDLPPGTFDITYTYASGPSKVSDCSLEAGIQRVF